jgi:hypothetical protein
MEALEELARAYDTVLGKHALPVLDVAQDGPHNQIRSTTSIEALPVQSEATVQQSDR